MAASDVLGAVCDRLVGGMMFHSDNADLCMLLGFKRLRKLHEEGYASDSRAHRKVRTMCLRMTNELPAQGRQERGRILDRWRSKSRVDIPHDERIATLKEAVRDWADWERDTAEIYDDAAKRLWDMGECHMSHVIAKMARSASEEMATACDLMCRLEACGWDATIA